MKNVINENGLSPAQALRHEARIDMAAAAKALAGRTGLTVVEQADLAEQARVALTAALAGVEKLVAETAARAEDPEGYAAQQAAKAAEREAAAAEAEAAEEAAIAACADSLNAP